MEKQTPWRRQSPSDSETSMRIPSSQPEDGDSFFGGYGNPSANPTSGVRISSPHAADDVSFFGFVANVASDGKAGTVPTSSSGEILTVHTSSSAHGIVTPVSEAGDQQVENGNTGTPPSVSKPKKFKNSFLQYFSTGCKTAKDTEQVVGAQTVGTLWKGLSEEEKQVYKDRADAERETWKSQMEKYKEAVKTNPSLNNPSLKKKKSAGKKKQQEQANVSSDMPKEGWAVEHWMAAMNKVDSDPILKVKAILLFEVDEKAVRTFMAMDAGLRSLWLSEKFI